MKKLYPALFLAGGFILYSQAISAQRNIIYTIASGDWTNSANWNLKRIPTSNDSIIITEGKAIAISTNLWLANSFLKIYGTLKIDEPTIAGEYTNLDIHTITNKSSDEIVKLMTNSASLQRGRNGNGNGRIRVQVNSTGNYIVKYISGNVGLYGPASALNTTFGSFYQQSQASLPVILVDFSITKNEKKVELRWKSPQENNNESYIVERSCDAKEWNKIAEIKAIVYSTMPKYYNYTDESPLYGISYYRLRILDRDGRYGITQVKAIRNSVSGTKPSVYPNPAIQKATIFVNDTEASGFNIYVYDRTGKIVARHQALDGSNVITIDVSRLVPGDYSANVISNLGNYQVVRFMVAAK